MLLESKVAAARKIVDDLLEHIGPYDPRFNYVLDRLLKLDEALDASVPSQLTPSTFQLSDVVKVVIPAQATLKECRVIKVSFDSVNQGEARYDVSVPYLYYTRPGDDTPAYGFIRIHGLREHFLHRPEADVEEGPAKWTGGDDR